MSPKSPYSDTEIQEIFKVYNSPFGSIKELSARLGRSKANICRFARKFGLTNRNRKKPKKFISKNYRQKQFLFSRALGQWKRKEHPKGMLGKTHSKDLRERMSIRMKSQWKDKNSFFNSQERKQKMSDFMKKLRASKIITNPYSRAKRGRRSDIGDIFFKSRWEANFARYLEFLKKNGSIFKWEYEEDRFEFHKIRFGTRSYLPDFKVFDTETSEPYYYEIKGWMDRKSIVRLKRMSKYYPSVKIILISQKEYKEIENKLGGLIQFWEYKNAPDPSVLEDIKTLDA